MEVGVCLSALPHFKLKHGQQRHGMATVSMAERDAGDGCWIRLVLYSWGFSNIFCGFLPGVDVAVGLLNPESENASGIGEMRAPCIHSGQVPDWLVAALLTAVLYSSTIWQRVAVSSNASSQWIHSHATMLSFIHFALVSLWVLGLGLWIHWNMEVMREVIYFH